LAPVSFIIGEVPIEEGTGIWNGAVVRGDYDSVEIGIRATVLENCASWRLPWRAPSR